MIKHCIYIYIILFVFEAVNSQSGFNYWVNYKLDAPLNPVGKTIIQDENGTMLFASPQGILTFDSEEWILIKTPSAPQLIYLDSLTNIIWIGCKNNIGYLSRIDNSGYQFIDNSNSAYSNGSLHQIICSGDALYFLTENTIISFDRNTLKLKSQWEGTLNGTFNGVLQYNNNLYVNISGAGLQLINNDTIWPTSFGQKFAGMEILFALSLSSKKTIFGCSNDSLYYLEKDDIHPFIIDDQEYLSAAILKNGLVFQDHLLVLTTLAGGALVVDINNGKTKEIINLNSGLPDNEIVSSGIDNGNGLWLSHQYGISRVDFSIPIRIFHPYQGLEGSITDICKFSNQLFVSTNEGLFFLKETKIFEEKEVLKKIIRPVTKTTIEIPVNQSEEPVKKRRFFGFLSKEDEGENSADKSSKILNVNEAASKQQKPSSSEILWRREKIRELQGINYVFTKIEDLDRKCKELAIFRNQLLVATNFGLYAYSNEKLSLLIPNVYVNQILPVNSDKCFVGTSQGVYSLNYLNDEWYYEKNPDIDEDIVSMAFYKNELFIGGNGFVVHFPSDDSLSIIDVDPEYQSEVHLVNTKDDLLIVTIENIFKWANDTIIPLNNADFVGHTTGQSFFSSDLLYTFSDGMWYKYINGHFIENSYLLMFDDLVKIKIEGNEQWVVNQSNEIFRINEGLIVNYKPELKVVVKSLTDYQGLKFSLENTHIEYQNNSIKVKIAAPFYLKSFSTQYQYKINGLRPGWSTWSSEDYIDIPYLPSGKFTIMVRARNVLGTISEIKEFTIVVNPPFWLTKWFIISVILIIGFIIVFAVKYRERSLQNANKILEERVKERTLEIENQKNKIELQNKDITDSINYAKKIQDALLPSNDVLIRNLKEHFILFRPRDIVSGDFYWAERINDKLILAAIDCTGHGVPGALLSMLGISFLNEIVIKNRLEDTSEILHELRKYIMKALKQKGLEMENKDGMDMSLVIIEEKKKIIKFSGAYNSLYKVRDKSKFDIDKLTNLSKQSQQSESHVLEQINADKMPIGISEKVHQSFTMHQINYESGDAFYIFTDGFADQFGGVDHKKYTTRKFKKLILKIQSFSMEDQKNYLVEEHLQWKGGEDQVDDILVIGFRI